mmetsp:Transcript_42109/g.70259  ORF Transcript_42109/g.70259 Transcript_42109/m.70259 type:complete len:188 (-) Transcript_42109:602-1165(-)
MAVVCSPGKCVRMAILAWTRWLPRHLKALPETVSSSYPGRRREEESKISNKKKYVLPWIYRASSWVKSKVTLKLILGSVFNLAFVACLFFFLIPFCSTYIGATLVGISYPFLKSMESISLPLPSPPPPNPSSDEAKGGEDQKTAVADGDVENGGGKEEKKVEGGTARDSQWLTYWVVFACVHFTDVW